MSKKSSLLSILASSLMLVGCMRTSQRPDSEVGGPPMPSLAPISSEAVRGAHPNNTAHSFSAQRSQDLRSGIENNLDTLRGDFTKSGQDGEVNSRDEVVGADGRDGVSQQMQSSPQGEHQNSSRRGQALGRVEPSWFHSQIPGGGAAARERERLQEAAAIAMEQERLREQQRERERIMEENALRATPGDRGRLEIFLHDKWSLPECKARLKDPQEYSPTSLTASDLKKVEFYKLLDFYEKVCDYDAECGTGLKLNMQAVAECKGQSSLPPMPDVASPEDLAAFEGIARQAEKYVEVGGVLSRKSWVDSISLWALDGGYLAAADSEGGKIMRRALRLFKILNNENQIPAGFDKDLIFILLRESGTTCKDAALNGLVQAELALESALDAQSVGVGAVNLISKKISSYKNILADKLIAKIESENLFGLRGYGEMAEVSLYIKHVLCESFGLTQASPPTYWSYGNKIPYAELTKLYMELLTKESSDHGISELALYVRDSVGAELMERSDRDFEHITRSEVARQKGVIDILSENFNCEIFNQTVAIEENRRFMLSLCDHALAHKGYYKAASEYGDQFFVKLEQMQEVLNCIRINDGDEGGMLVEGSMKASNVKSLFEKEAEGEGGCFSALYDVYLDCLKRSHIIKDFVTDVSIIPFSKWEEKRCAKAMDYLDAGYRRQVLLQEVMELAVRRMELLMSLVGEETLSEFVAITDNADRSIRMSGIEWRIERLQTNQNIELAVQLLDLMQSLEENVDRHNELFQLMRQLEGA